MKNICVFCGSSIGERPVYAETAGILGDLLAEHGYGLIYGGSNIGLMGKVSATVRDAGGAVTGIIPERIAAYVEEQKGISLEVVPGMHERKARMYELSDGFIAMPGGIGTLEEIFEAWTWNQLGYHSKPVALLNTKGYFNHLDSFLGRVSREGFLKQGQLETLIIESDPGRLLEKMEKWIPFDGLKWE